MKFNIIEKLNHYYNVVSNINVTGRALVTNEKKYYFKKVLFQWSRKISCCFKVEECLIRLNDNLGLSDSDNGIDERDGIYAYLGKPDTNTLV